MGKKENFVLVNTLEIAINGNRPSKFSSPELGVVSEFVAGDFFGSFFRHWKNEQNKYVWYLKITLLLIVKPSQFKTKRIYEDPSKDDGYRVLVDRLWPRGVSKEEARLDEWLKEIAPSTDLRKWFDHDPDKFDEFANRYKGELTQKEEVIESSLKKAEEQTVTLLYAAKDEKHNHALVLKDFLEEHITWQIQLKVRSQRAASPQLYNYRIQCRKQNKNSMYAC